MEISFEEKIIWDRYQRNCEDSGLVLTYVFEITGNVDIKKLEKALGKAVEYFSESFFNSFSATRFGVRKRNVSFFEKYLHIFGNNFSIDAAFCKKQICLEEGKLFFFALEVPGSKDESYKLFLSFSHICFDGLSYTPFVKKLADFYNFGTKLRIKQLDNNLPPSIDNVKGANYWKHKIETSKLHQRVPFLLESEDESSSRESYVIKSIIQGHRLDKFYKLCEACGATCFQIMATVLGLVLYKYCDEEITLFYTCTTNRKKDRVGCYLNLLPLSFQINNDLSIRECIECIKKEREEAREFSTFPFKEILSFASEIGRNPFNILINESEGLLPLYVPNFSQCTVKLVKTPDLSGPYDLSLIYNKNSDKIVYAISAPINKVTTESLKAFEAIFDRALNFVLNSSLNVSIKSFTLGKKLSPILSGKKFKISPDDTVINHFLENFKRYPDRVAVSCGNKNITYKELNGLREKILTRLLNENSVAPVAFFLSRTEFVPAVMLAALSIGRAYVPIDAKLPIGRIKYILDSSGATVIFVDNFTCNKLNGLNKDIKIINVAHVSTDKRCDSRRKFRISHKDSAYILFTSGSTGNPKGVLVTQGNLINFLYSMVGVLGIDSHSKILAITSVSFDISVLELILPLFVGASVDLVSDDDISDLFELSHLIDSSKINVLQATPATFRGLRSIQWKPKNALLIVCGGEVLDKELSLYLLDIGNEVYNVYGPTETTVWSSFSKITKGNDISIGEPIYNTKYFVVDEDMNPVPIGKEGQLLISGNCVSMGYINDPDNVNFRTIRRLKDTGKIYCTGDIVKYLGNKNLVYVGRRDNQVKINGYRIDLSEIQRAILKTYKNIDFFITLRKNNCQKRKSIICFYTNDVEHKFDESLCKEKLRLSLPGYMIPEAFYYLKTIPTNINGKVDIKFLSEADINDIALVKPIDEGPRDKQGLNNAKVKEVCAVLHDTLNINTSDFNAPLGYLGLDSVMYTQLAATLNEHFKIKIRPHEFYKFSTLEDLILCILGNDITLEATKHESIKGRIEIYVLGMSALLPSGMNKEAFWDALVQKKDLITVPVKQRGLSQNFKGGYLTDIEAFDNAFFSISALEASSMDPRQKQLLQIAWEAIEDAAISKHDLMKKKVGCYIATTGGDYCKCEKEQNVYSMTGRAMSIMANRISRYFDWRGPSMTIDTACSGSLVALAQAYNDLTNGICDFAFVGSANIISDEQNSEALKIGNFLSKNFRCATFDQSADGYVRSEGICGVFLARSDVVDAEEYHNVVRGSIESVALGHGGKASSLTAPNMSALTELYLEAYDKKLLKEVSYIETHGTGTRLGDPIEVTSLKNAWNYLLEGHFDQNVYLGAVKTNIGHTEASAGLTSVIKVLSSFEHQLLVSNIHFNKLNSEIDLVNTPFKILEQNIAWNFCANRVAGVSSFGFGGMNAHVVLKEFKNIKNDIEEYTPQKQYVIPISARSEQALLGYINKLKSFLKNSERGKLRLSDISYTLSVGRTHFEYRCAFIVDSIDNLIEQLDNIHISFVPTGKLIQNKQEGFQKMDLTLVAEKFLEGVPILWDVIFGQGQYKRIHLPTYVFRR